MRAFRITRTELDAWIAHPQHRLQTTLWDAADGGSSGRTPQLWSLRLEVDDGKLWLWLEGVQVLDPQHLASNPLRLRCTSSGSRRTTVRWQHLPGGTAAATVRLPPHVRDVQIDYTALSLVAPEKIRFRYRLDGQDRDWRRSSTSDTCSIRTCVPAPYRFRVIATNNSGVWNEQGDVLEFSIAPAYHQTPGSVRSASRVLWACSGPGTGSGSGSCTTVSRWRSRRA